MIYGYARVSTDGQSVDAKVRQRRRTARSFVGCWRCTRTSEGGERVKARGVKLARKPKPTPHQRREAIKRRDKIGEPVRRYRLHSSASLCI